MSLRLSSPIKWFNISLRYETTFLLFAGRSIVTPKGISLRQRGYINYAAAKSRSFLLTKEVVLYQLSRIRHVNCADSQNTG